MSYSLNIWVGVYGVLFPQETQIQQVIGAMYENQSRH